MAVIGSVFIWKIEFGNERLTHDRHGAQSPERSRGNTILDPFKRSRFLIWIGNVLFRHRNWVLPFLFACIFAIGIPPSEVFGSEVVEHIKDGIAILIALTGLVLRALVIGHRYVKRSGEKRSVQADTLFQDGLFCLCRNPLYTGNVLVILGICVMHGNIYAVFIGTIASVFIYRSIIAAEENFLREKFGADYIRYCSQVPRWIPNVLRVPKVIASQPFSLSRVLIVEYTNIGITVGALALMEFYEEVEEPLDGSRGPYVAVLASIIALALTWIALMRVLKKRKILVTP